MAETVRTRLNHYQVLGIPTSADGDEIARAFARESSVFRPHVFGGLTEVCVAYEVLRDPARRRAYDASIGLVRKPEPPKWALEVRGAATAETMVRAASVEQRAPLPSPQPESLKRAIPLRPEEESTVRPEPAIGRGDPLHLPFAEVLEADVRPIDWKRAGIALGGFVVAACALGGLAGWWSVSGMSEASEPKNSVSVPLPSAKPVSTPRAPEVAAAAATGPIVEARPDGPRPTKEVAAIIQRNPAAPEPAAADELAPQEPADMGAAEPAAEETPTAAAPMPLSNRLIARTIERIGYSCGSVASTAPVEGEAPGVYRVTCSSGQSYQAKPVNGRYRFRRLGR